MEKKITYGQTSDEYKTPPSILDITTSNSNFADCSSFPRLSEPPM